MGISQGLPWMDQWTEMQTKERQYLGGEILCLGDPCQTPRGNTVNYPEDTTLYWRENGDRFQMFLQKMCIQKEKLEPFICRWGPQVMSWETQETVSQSHRVSRNLVRNQPALVQKQREVFQMLALARWFPVGSPNGNIHCRLRWTGI